MYVSLKSDCLGWVVTESVRHCEANLLRLGDRGAFSGKGGLVGFGGSKYSG